MDKTNIGCKRNGGCSVSWLFKCDRLCLLSFTLADIGCLPRSRISRRFDSVILRKMFVESPRPRLFVLALPHLQQRPAGFCPVNSHVSAFWKRPARSAGEDSSVNWRPKDNFPTRAICQLSLHTTLDWSVKWDLSLYPDRCCRLPIFGDCHSLLWRSPMVSLSKLRRQRWTLEFSLKRPSRHHYNVK